MLDLTARINTAISERSEQGRLRSLRNVIPGEPGCIVYNGKQLINFASNDYLGLSQHPLLKQRAIEFTELYGTGSGASRLVCGNLEPFESIERKLAELKGTEDALIFSSGFQLNATALPALGGTGSFLACDRLAHNSLLEGAQLNEGRWTRFQHNDTKDLDERLGRAPAGCTNKWIVTESVFSMDGDVADLAGIADVATGHGANVFLDEAHATGVMGKNGMGLSVGKNDVTVGMGTFSKGAGCFGAYIACSRALKQYLVNFCPGIIFSTALPPPVLGAIDAALDLIPTMDNQREQLMANADTLRDNLKQLGYDTADSQTQIVPVIVGDDNAALALASHLEENGIFASAIRPPTVPEGTARVRVSLTAAHTREHIDILIRALRDFHVN